MFLLFFVLLVAFYGPFANTLQMPLSTFMFCVFSLPPDNLSLPPLLFQQIISSNFFFLTLFFSFSKPFVPFGLSSHPAATLFLPASFLAFTCLSMYEIFYGFLFNITFPSPQKSCRTAAPIFFTPMLYILSVQPLLLKSSVVILNPIFVGLAF